MRTARTLRVRELNVSTLQHAADTKPLQAAASERRAAKADATERALADAYLLLDVPPHAVPWRLGTVSQIAATHALRGPVHVNDRRWPMPVPADLSAVSVYVICEPSCHAYAIITQAKRMPCLVEQAL